jgi:hypothetical protein
MEIIKRAGFTSNHKDFQTAFVPFWPSEFETASPTSWVGRLTQHRRAAQAIHQRNHSLNEMYRGVVPGAQPVNGPDLDARRRYNEQEHKTLVNLERQTIDISDEIARKRREVKINFNPAEIELRKERRAYLRIIADEKARMAAITKNENFRLAALETDPEISGVPASLHRQLHDETLRTLFPQDVSDLDAATKALEIQAETLKSTRKAIESERAALGELSPAQVAPEKKAVGWA